MAINNPNSSAVSHALDKILEAHSASTDVEKVLVFPFETFHADAISNLTEKGFCLPQDIHTDVLDGFVVTFVESSLPFYLPSYHILTDHEKRRFVFIENVINWVSSRLSNPDFRNAIEAAYKLWEASNEIK